MAHVLGPLPPTCKTQYPGGVFVDLVISSFDHEAKMNRLGYVKCEHSGS